MGDFHFVDVRFNLTDSQVKILEKMANDLNLSLYELIKKIVTDKIEEAK